MKVIRYELKRSDDVLLEISCGEKTLHLRVYGEPYAGECQGDPGSNHDVSRLNKEAMNYFLQQYGVEERTLIVEKGD